MASWKEIERIRKDVGSAKRIAASLLKTHSDFSDWEKDFLEAMTSRDDDYELTTRQSEKLLQVRDDCEETSEYRGFSIQLLIKQVFEARFDLGQADEDWIDKIWQRGSLSVKRKHVGRLIRCAKELFIIDGEIAA